MKRFWLVTTLLLLATGCGRRADEPAWTPPPSTPQPEPVTAADALREVAPEDLPALWDDGALDDDGWADLRLALDRDLRWLRGRPPGREHVYGPRRVTVAELRDALERVRAWLDDDPAPDAFAARVVRHFDVYESVGDDKRDARLLVTGYYEPVIDGSLRRSAEYHVPVYAPPGNLVRVDLGDFDERWRGERIAGILKGRRLVPFPDRRGLRQDRSVMRGREIAWVRDPVDLFFVEVQGSGALRLPGGRELRIGYAGSNGRPYRSIGKLLIDEGEVPRERMSMQAIRDYLARHPDDLHRVLDHNPSVVFFRRLDGPPVGALGVPVTPGRSIAVDLRLLPRGAFGFLLSERPAPGPGYTTVVEGPLTRFVVAQDTGGAIRGADRVDFFWGRGADAAGRAGVMKQPGRLLVFVPKSAR